MAVELSIIDESLISQGDKLLVDNQIDAICKKLANNRQALNALTFESAAALSEVEKGEKELKSKSVLARFIGSLTGSNKALEDKINSNRTIAQYASQRILRNLAERNSLSFEAISVLNTKINSEMEATRRSINSNTNKIADINEELATINNSFIKFLKRYRNDLQRLEMKIEHIENNMRLIKWSKYVRHSMFDDEEYIRLDDISKLVCVVADFYELTGGVWNPDDLMLLQSVMDDLKLDSYETINVFEALSTIAFDKRLREKYLNNQEIVCMPESSRFLAMAVIKKLDLLANEEKYLVDASKTALEMSGIEVTEKMLHNLESNLAIQYFQAQFGAYLNVEIECFDLAKIMLFNLQQAEYAGILCNGGSTVALNGNTMMISSGNDLSPYDLFLKGKLSECRESLEALAEAGETKANLLLYWLYKDGCTGCVSSSKKIKKWLEDGCNKNDPCCSLLYAIYYMRFDERDNIIKKYMPKVEEMADAEDPFASFVLAMYYQNNIFLSDDEKVNKFKQYIANGAKAGFYKAFAYGAALELSGLKDLYLESIKEFEDNVDLLLYSEYWHEDVRREERIQKLKELSDAGVAQAKVGLVKLNEKLTEYEKITLLKEAVDLGYDEAYAELASMYCSADEELHTQYLKNGIENDNVLCMYKLAGELSICWPQPENYDEAERLAETVYKSANLVADDSYSTYFSILRKQKKFYELDRVYVALAERGYTQAYELLGDLYDDTDFKDKAKSIRYYRMAKADGNADAGFKLGQIYLSDYTSSYEIDDYSRMSNVRYTGNPEDMRSALAEFKWAAENGHDRAYYELAKIYYRGLVIEQDLDEAFKWCGKAVEVNEAEPDYSDYTARCLYGNILYDLEYYNNALESFNLFIDNGCAEWIPNFDIQTMMYVKIGKIYYYGYCGSEDNSKAFEYFLKAVQQNIENGEAYYYLGLIEDNNGNYYKAKEYYEKAIENGCNDAYNSIAIIYDSGNGVAQDYIKANKYFKASGDSGHAIGYYNLGINFKCLLGVTDPSAMLIMESYNGPWGTCTLNNVSLPHLRTALTGNDVYGRSFKYIALMLFIKAYQMGYEKAYDNIASVTSDLNIPATIADEISADDLDAIIKMTTKNI